MKLDIDISDTLYWIIKVEGTKTASHIVWVMLMIETIKDGVPHVNTDRTVQDFADKCRECGTQYIRKSVIEDIKAEIEHIDRHKVKFTSMYTRPDLIDMVVDEVLSIIDRHMKEGE